MARSKNKGNAFEWETARALSRWLTNGTDSSQLLRSTGSGGWQGRPTGDGRHAGDLAANGPAGERFREYFAVECKHHKTIDLWHLWTAKPAENIAGWWRKLWHECCSVEPCPAPLLIVKMNFRPVLVGVPDALVPAGAEHMVFAWPGPPGRTLPPIALMLLDVFTAESPESWYEEIKAWRGNL